MKKNLIFTGIKHSGKTTQARLVSTYLGLPFHDLDDLVLSSSSCDTIRQLYIEEGKEAFMKRETRAYTDLLEKEKNVFVLSLGGGAADNEELMEKVKDGNLVIYIKRPEEVLLEKILRDGVPPFLDRNNIRESFHALFMKRNAIYDRYADISMYLGEFRDKRETAVRIIGRLKEEGYEF